jgi:hypothetical protein
VQTIKNSPTVFVDAHVHIHDCFNINNFMHSALQNFVKYRKKTGADENSFNALLLTETARADYFSKLYQLESINDNQNGSLTIQRTDEDCSLLIKFSNRQHLILIAGRQIVTAERLEVLALCTNKKFKDGEPIVDVIEKVQKADALAVVPWGFGKWIGKRSMVMDSLLDKINEQSFFLGDNSGRLMLTPEPRYFIKARNKGIQILPGTDPLPFASEFRRPGSFGFYIPGELSDKRPASELKKLLRNAAISITPYGRLETPLRFIKNQLAMQIVKHKY